MNIIDVQDNLKNFSEQQLISEMQRPSGNAPQFLVLSEIQRRKRVRDDFAKREAANEPTVAQEAIAAAGVPQSGVMGMREAMNPKRTMVQNMRSGGLMALGGDIQRGFSGKVEPFLDEVKGMAESRFDIDLDSSLPQRATMPMVNPSNIAPRPMTPRVGSGKGGTPTAGSSAFGSPLAMTQDFRSRSSYANENDYMKGIAGLMSNVLPMKEGGVIKAQDGGPLGFRLNNVGNIRPGAGFYGETGSDSGYASFKDQESGLRALSRLINTYSDSYGIDNVRDFVGRYAPRSDNPKSFDNYVSYLSNQLGVEPDESFDLTGRRSELIPAIIGFEQGREYSDMFDDDTISRAIKSSQFDDESEIESALYGKNDDEDTNFAKQLMQSIIPRAQASTILPEPEVNDEKKVSRKQMYEDALSQSGYSAPETSNLQLQQKAIERANDKELAKKLTDLGNITSFEPFTTDVAPFNPDTEDRKNINPSILPNRILSDKEIAEIEKRREEIPDATAEAIAQGAFPFLRSDDEIAKRRKEAQESLSSGDDNEFLSAYQKKTQETDDRKRENIAKRIEELAQDDEDVPTLPPITSESSETTDNKDKKSTDDSLPVSSLEQQIIDLQNRLEKNREQDKYLALAQAGLAIMASDSPTLAGAIGEGGVDGLKAFREANQRYEEGVIDLINARAKLKGKTTAGLTPNQALDAAIEYEKIANDLSLDDATRANAKSMAIRLRMMSGIENVGSGAYFDLTADS